MSKSDVILSVIVSIIVAIFGTFGDGDKVFHFDSNIKDKLSTVNNPPTSY